MSINKEIKNSGKEPEVTLSVRWPTNKKEGTNSYAMLDGARVLILDENKLKGVDKKDWYKQSGLVRYLSEGKCTFSPPLTNYKVMIFAEYNEEINGKHIPRFSAHSDAYLDDETTGRRLPWSISFSNQTTFDIEDGKHNGIWSIFQAGVDLFKTSKKEKYLGYTPNQFLEIQCSEGNTETNTDYSTKIINVQKNNEGIDHSWDWNKIAHEFAHFIANDTQAVVGNPGGKHSLDVNQYDYAENEKGAYQNKELSMRLAFAEGYATWLGKCLLNGSKYLQADYALPAGSSIIGIGDSLYDYQYDLNKNVQDIPDLHNGIVTYRLTRFGEDAEIAIARLLWNITNKKNGQFLRISDDYPENKVQVSLKTLFDKVFKGNKLKNINDFYEKLFHYYVEVDPKTLGQKKNWELSSYELLFKINALGDLFAEFGMAPYVRLNRDDYGYDFQAGNSLTWHQYKTGWMLGHDKFYIHVYDRDSGIFSYLGEVKNNKTDRDELKHEYRLTAENISSIRSAIVKRNPHYTDWWIYNHIRQGLSFIVISETKEQNSDGEEITRLYFSNTGNNRNSCE